MVKKIDVTDQKSIGEVAEFHRRASRPLALTGAGISVECGIPDFRSAGGLWSIYNPEEYATLQVFLNDPEKAWTFYRSLGKTLAGKEPGPAHYALAELESRGYLRGVVTQNIDGLHTEAGSGEVVEVHGDHRHLHCLQCAQEVPVSDDHFQEGPLPRCHVCGFPLKPNVVLYGELVHGLDVVDRWLEECDLLLVIGTSAEVYPVAGLPHRVLNRGGAVLEFNVEETGLTARSTYLLQGKAGVTLPRFAEAVLGRGGK